MKGSDKDEKVIIFSKVIFTIPHKKWTFPLRISSENVTKSAASKSKCAAYWLVICMCLRSLTGRKDLLNIQHVGGNVCFDFSFLSCDHNIYIVTIAAGFKDSEFPCYNFNGAPLV